MQLSQVKKALMAATAVSGFAIAGLAVWAFWEQPVELDETIHNAGGSLGATSGVVESPKPERDFGKLSSMLLRGPRVAETITAPVEAGTVAPVQPAFSIKLLGTVVDQGRTLGLFQDSAGGFDVKSVGESLELVPQGVQIASLEVGKALVRYSGKEIDLRLSSGGIVTPQPVQPPQPMMDGEMPSPSPQTFQSPVQPYVMPPATANSGTSADDIFSPLPANMDITNPANFGGVPPVNQNGQP